MAGETDDLDGRRASPNRRWPTVNSWQRKRDSNGFVVLSEEELQILGLLASDATIDALACDLGISFWRFRKQVEEIYYLLGATTRHGAIAAAFRQGLLI